MTEKGRQTKRETQREREKETQRVAERGECCSSSVVGNEVEGEQQHSAH